MKNPKKGEVKTRLAATVGDDRAFAIYQTLLAYTRRVSLQVDAERQVWYSQNVTENDGWDTAQFTKKKQRGNSLGERMQYAFGQVFNEGYEKAVIIGSDCGQLQPRHIKKAFQALDNNEVVIGPSEDGGYYLLGMTRLWSDLFKDKTWGTKHVFDQTVDECKRSGLSYYVLEELNDVDTKEDWEQIKDWF